jgi:NAD dependent epimerase/dehydratase family enzyme
MHISHKDFTLTIASILNKKIFLPNTPAFLIKLIFGNRSNLILNGSRISSNKIKELGYTFKFPKLEGALKNIFQKALN